MSSTPSPDTGWGPLVCVTLAAALATALGVELFKRAVDMAEWLSYGSFAPTWSDVGVPGILIIPIIGGLVVGLILHAAGVAEEPGHGVTEVIEAVTLGVEDYPEHETPVKSVVAAASLGSGASLGPEDPAVEIGGSLGHFMSRKLGFDDDGIQTIIAAGAAAGLAAAFHAPIAAVAFAIEVFALRLASRTTFLLALAATTAYLPHLVLSSGPDVHAPALRIATPWEVPLVLVIGVVAGVLSAGLIRLMYTVEHAFLDLQRVPRWLKPVMGGALIGVAGLLLPDLLGTGYRPLNAILAGEHTVLWLLAAFALGKLVLMAVSFGSGFLGGFFAPSLFVGAAAGAAIGVATRQVVPAADVSIPLMAVIGMAAVVAGSVRAPFAAALLVAGISGSWVMTPLILVATLLAERTSRALEQHSLYTYGLTHPTGRRHHRKGRGRPQHDVAGGLKRSER